MKTDIAKQFPYKGDLYGYVLVTSEDGSTTERRYAINPTEVSMSLSVNLLGELVIESETKMQIDSYLKNIKDKNGDEIYTSGEWQILQTAPILNPIGIKSGYKYRAKLIAGAI